MTVENDRRDGIDRRTKQRFPYALEVVPTFRRVASLPDKLGNGDTTTALGMASLALINLPEDLRDVGGALNQLTGAKPKYDHKEFQHDFSFFRGTAIEKWLHKHVDMDKKWANWLYDNDKTLADTTFGEKINKIVNAEEKGLIKTSITDYSGNSAFAFAYKGTRFGQLTARALRRTTLFGVCAMGLLELPKIIKSDEKAKQTAKSAVNLMSITAGIGYGGAFGFKHAGNIGSLVGMGFGAVLGSKLSNRAQDII